MTSDGLLARTLKVLTGRGREISNLRPSDLASLQVALMVAALDGKIQPDEFRSFARLAKKCDGATPEKIGKAFDAALRSAGYVLLQSFRLPEKALVELFVREALKLLPKELPYGRPRAVRAAFATWLTMAMSDGDYSGVERACLEGLFRRLREQVLEHYRTVARDAGMRMTYVRVSEREIGESARDLAAKFLPDDFLAKAEKALSALAKRADAASSEDELHALIG